MYVYCVYVYTIRTYAHTTYKYSGRGGEREKVARVVVKSFENQAGTESEVL